MFKKLLNLSYYSCGWLCTGWMGHDSRARPTFFF